MFEVSETGRKIRKDSFEAAHDMNFVSSKLRELYSDKQLSTTEIPAEIEKTYGIKINKIKCYYLLRRMGLLRNRSESVSLARSTLDYSTKIITPTLSSIIDGIVIGDGHIETNHNTKVARLSISGVHKEFINYCRRLLLPYEPCEAVYNTGEKGLGTWSITTKHHPDLYQAYLRWYSNDGKKDVPNDIELDKMTLLLWYLGDGSLSAKSESNSRSLFFATNAFSIDAIEQLVAKFKNIGIECQKITKDNRLGIKAKSIVKLLGLMGGESPVKCYSYKFDLEDWRFLKTLHEVAIEVNIDYQRLASWVKTGFVRHSRSPGGKKVLFNQEELMELKNRIASGELSIEKGRKTKLRYKTDSDIFTTKFVLQPAETEDAFLNRVVDNYYKHGFPYKVWREDQLLKEWYGLRKSQYIIPDIDIIKWRNEGFSFADYFHPHIFEINYKHKMSPLELFNDREKFKYNLKKYIGMGGLLTYSGVLAALCRLSQSKRVNNFSPLTARDIYNYYCKDGYRVLDPCAGFSGRLIGASISRSKLEYFGIEPNTKTFSGLIKTKEFIKKTNEDFKCNIINDCSETYLESVMPDSFDFCFTSPPYFDREEYSKEKTQSFIKYPEYELWLSGFLKKTMFEIYRVLKKSSCAVINIGSVEKYDIPSDLINISKEIGFNVEAVKNIAFKQYRFVSNMDERLEPLIILKK
jgi:16S rRNA G966 N2-methylase RsmD